MKIAMKFIFIFCLVILAFGKYVKNEDDLARDASFDDGQNEKVSIEEDEKLKETSNAEKYNDSDKDDKLDERLGKTKEPSKTDDEVIEREGEAINLDGLNVSQMKELREKAEKYKFQTEVDRMMKLIINSLYKNKEIFLRELISNASDALDKVRFISLTNPDIDHDNDDLVIRIKADKIGRTLHILDTGIGMSKEELVNNLGTIAKSGTNDFFQKATDSKDVTELNDLIGQFGVGFYSSFLVADRVTVISKSDTDQQYIWESDASSFSISQDPRGNTLRRGSEIILHLKEEAAEYLEIETLKSLVHKYSQFINFPIYLWTTTVKNVEESSENAMTKNDDDTTVEDEQVNKTVEKEVSDWELINKSKPIWNRKSGEISDDEYNEFFKSFSKETEDPLARTHFTAEGEVTFKAILYVPSKAPEDLNNNVRTNDNIKLYVKRVFITDTFNDLMPTYLSFIKGIVDSDDLPLNVSRETLQQHKLLKVIRKKLIRKSLDMLMKLNDETYQNFWSEYSTSIKLGTMEDVSNRNRLAKLLRFWSSATDEKKISLTDYVSRMKPNQEFIFFMASNSLEDVKKSPMVEALLKRQYEVLYLVDSIDEHTIESIPEFEGKTFQNVAKEGFKLDDSDIVKENREKLAQSYSKLSDWLKDDVFHDSIDKVEISERLSDTPCIIVALSHGWSGNMERIMKAQSNLRQEDSNDRYQINRKKILEINPEHLLIKQLKYSFERNNDLNETRKLASILYDTAMLRSGYSIQDITGFSKRVDEVVRTSLNIPLDETADEDEEAIGDIMPENSEIKLDTPNFDNSNPMKTISFATFRKLLHIEDDDELDVDEDSDENEEKLEEANDDDVSEEEDNDVDEEEAEENDEENEEDSSNSYEELADDDDNNLDEETKDDEEETSEEEDNNDQDEDEEDSVKMSSMSYKRRKLHSIHEKEHKYRPTPNDHDCDGIPDDEDDDVDNDGLLDHTQDSDWDGELNHFDEDDDNDGIPDVDDPDSNGDGIPDCREDSSDNKLRLRYKRKQKVIDSDMDGVPDEADIDDDEDGIPDILEDLDGDNIPDILNKYKETDDISDLTAILAAAGWKDHDCDGIPDQYDPDDDNDGYFDKKQDSDRDGNLNEYDDDDDNDGIPDDEDPDSNGDGILDCIPKDSDGDGIPDHIDTDDDNDGTPDLKDPNHPLYNFFVDSDKDGIPDSLDNDDDNDGIPDHYDYDSDGDGESDLFPDKDKDGVPDNIDNDMNNDGILDHMQDRDCDGIPDMIDPDDDNDGFFDNKQDSDNDGTLNEWDDDDDNDGIPDIHDPDSNGDGIIDCKPRDSDGDGIPDHLDPDDDNDGIPDHLDPDSMSFLLFKKTQHLDALPASQARHEANTENIDLGDPGDKDCDGIPDDEDQDNDNDGKIDRTQDSDLDGDLNHVDEDDDNDGIPDVEDPDANGDGIPDCRRDDEINYKLIKSRTGKIKRVLRIKKQTEEENTIENQKRDVNIKLLKQRALEIGKSDTPIKDSKFSIKKKGHTTTRKTTTSTEAKTSHAPMVKTTTKPKPKPKPKPKEQISKKKEKEIITKIVKKVTAKPTLKQEIKKAKATEIKVKVQKEVKPKKTKSVSKKETKKKSTKSKTPVESKKITKPTKTKKSIKKVVKKIVKAFNDHDCDGIPDNTDNDFDNDGVNDAEQDSDHDGIVNSLDSDDDNDGIADVEDPDANGDGIPDCKMRSNVTPKKPKIKIDKKVKVKGRKLLSVETDEDDNDEETESENAEGYEDIDEEETAEDAEEEEPVEEIKQKTNVKKGNVQKEKNTIINQNLKKKSTLNKITKVISKNMDSSKDSDGDGIPDYLEGDSDGDGIPDYMEDADGDGIPDYLDNDSDASKDSDGDGIPDDKEDEDGDGIPDYLQKDSDGDGIPDFKEDTDGDGIPDYLDKDSDGDGIPDYKEDADGDGIPDYLDKDTNIKKDSDGDGIPDYKEDEDGDGIPDYLQKDSDGDGIPDFKEDQDGDGIPDYLDKDSNGDGIPDYKEVSDGDGIPDYLDKDSTGISNNKKDSDGDGIPDYLEQDSDGDGIPDFKEDEDGDGIPDYLEKDSGGDGIPDYKEDQDGDGIPDYLDKDSDGDGIPDNKEDEDGDGIPDYLQKDSDGDGIPDFKEDSDGDGIPDYLDNDSSKMNYLKDTDGDGIPDNKEDEDGDGIPDYLEGDSDGDGIPDYQEDEDGDGIPDYLENDSDGDGIPDYQEDENGNGIPDYLEKDSDGDGIPDYKEDEDGDGIPDYLVKDSDGDGIPDFKEDDGKQVKKIPSHQHVLKKNITMEQSGIKTDQSKKKFVSPKDANKIDSDGDGIPDYLDDDDDNDGIPDSMEKTSPSSKLHCKVKGSCDTIVTQKIHKTKKAIDVNMQAQNVSFARMVVKQILETLEIFFGVDE